MPRVKKSLSEAVSKEIKSKFDLSAFKDKKGLKQNVKFKLGYHFQKHFKMLHQFQEFQWVI